MTPTDGGADLAIDGLSDYRELGAGGFSSVYAARDEAFGRDVAVKVLHALDADGRRRFDRERQLMGRLGDHPNIITPFRSGYLPDGRPFLVMQLAAGGSLQDVVNREGPLPWHQAVDWLVPVAEAVERAHREGILHRDIKPANILLTDDGHPKLTDFGIASIKEATSTSQQAFTLAHAPPETFADGRDQRSERSDVYSLGTTLFTLVAGHPPFHQSGDDSQGAYMFRVLHGPVPAVAGLTPTQQALLAATMAKDPDQRPVSADRLAQLLRASRSRSTAPVGPVPSDPVVHEVIGGITTAPDDGQPTGAAAETVNRQPTAVSHHGPVDERTGPGRRLVLGAAVVGLLVAGSLAVWSMLSGGTDDTAFTGHRGTVYALAVLPDGRVASGGADDTVQVWDPADPGADPVVYRGHGDNVSDLAVLDDGRIASASWDRTVQVWNPDDVDAPVIVFDGHADRVRTVAVLTDGRLASGADDDTVRVWSPDADPTDDVVVYERHRGNVFALAPLPDGRLASASGDSLVLVWSADRTFEEPTLFDGHRGDVWAVATIDDESTDIVSASDDNVALVWNHDDLGQAPAAFEGHDGDVRAVTALDDGRVATGGADDTVQVWDPADPAAPATVFTGHDGDVWAIVALPDGRLASAGADSVVRLWTP